MAKYRKKPVVIEAFQWKANEKNLGDLTTWASRVDLAYKKAHGIPLDEPHTKDGMFVLPLQVAKKKDGELVLFVQTPGGEHTAAAGDWIIHGVMGEFYPCKPEDFEATYEAAE